MCTLGICAGVLSCPANSDCVAWARKTRVLEIDNFGLQRDTQFASDDWTAGAFSLRNFTQSKEGLEEP